MAWITPITNRSQADVDRVNELLAKKAFNALTDDEKEEYLTSLKGALNKADFERIWGNIEVLAECYEVTIDTPVLPPTITLSYMEQLQSAITLLRNQQGQFSDTPQVPEQPYNSYEKINDIEKILDGIYRILFNNFYNYCGEVSCGEEINLL